MIIKPFDAPDRSLILSFAKKQGFRYRIPEGVEYCTVQASVFPITASFPGATITVTGSYDGVNFSAMPSAVTITTAVPTAPFKVWPGMWLSVDITTTSGTDGCKITVNGSSFLS